MQRKYRRFPLSSSRTRPARVKGNEDEKDSLEKRKTKQRAEKPRDHEGY